MRLSSSSATRALQVTILLALLGVSLGIQPPANALAQGLSFPVQINKSFLPITIPAGGVSVLSVTIFNPNSFALTLSTTPPAWTDDLSAASLSFASPAGASSTCGGIVTTVGATLALIGGTVPAQVGTTPGSCTVTANVTSTIAGNHVNTIPASSVNATDPTGTIQVTNTTPASATLRVNSVQPPSLSKAFNLNTIWAGQTSTLTITIRNNDTTYALTQVALTDNLPSNITVASAPASPQCGGGTVTSTPTSISLSGGSVAASGTCTVTATVTSVTPGVYTNAIPAGAIHTQQGVTNAGPASAPLNVQAIGITKSFSPSGFQSGGSSTLTITLQNPSGSDYTGASFTDNLPAGLSIVSTAASQCGGAVTATTASITLSGGVIPHSLTPPTPPGSCTITALVTSSTTATYTNSIPIGALTTTQGASNVLAANANLTVYGNGLGVSGSKTFSPTTITVGGNSRLRLTITAPADTNLTNFSVFDALPTNVTISNSTASTTSGCGASAVLTAVTGGTSLSLTGGTILKSASCQINVYVTSSTPTLPAAPYVNTISPPNISDAENRNVAGNFSANLTVSGLTVSKAFSPNTVNVNGISTLSITLTNTNTSQLDGVSLSDPLPGTTTNGVVIAPAPNASTTCSGGSVTAAAGTQAISMSNGIIPAQVGAVPGICTIIVDVVGKGTAATYTNTIAAGNVSGTIHNTSTVISNQSAATATLKILAVTIGVVKGFSPLTVFAGSASTLTVQLSNPNTVALSGIAFTDNLPQNSPGLGMMIANPPNPTVGTCGGTISAAAGATSFSFSGGSLAASTGCSLTLSVTMNVEANLTNTIAIGAVTSTNGASNTQAASATLTNLPGASLSKAFASNPVMSGAGNSSTLTFTIQNTGNVALSGMGFSDTFPAGMTATTFNASQCGGTVSWNAAANRLSLAGGSLAAGPANCTISVDVTAPAPKSYQNCVPAGGLADAQGATNQTAACDTLTVIAPPTIGKSFAPATIPAGAASALTFTLTNPAANTVPLLGAAFTDTFPAGLTLASVPNASQCGGSVSSTANSVTLTGGTIAVNSNCTVTVSVTAAAGGTYPNVSGTVTSTNGGTGNTASATLTVIRPPSISKGFLPNPIAAGGISTLTFTITNPNPANVLTGVGFTDALPLGMQVASTPNAGSLGCNASSTPVFAPAASDMTLSFSTGSIAAGGTCTVHVDLTAGGGDKLNTSSAVTSTNGGTGNTATSTLTVSGGGLSLAKSTTTAGYQAVGNSINYSYLLTNIGTVPLYPPYSVSDDKATVTCPSIPAIIDSLETVTCTASYTVQAGDVTTKTVTNTATATAMNLPAGGSTVTSNESSVTVPLEALTLTKSTSTLGYRVAGNTINYSYTLTNSGGATLYAPFNISDDHIGAPVGTPFTCGAATSLAPGANITCTKTYTVTEPPDVTNGSVTNAARGTAMDAASGGNTVTSNQSSVTVYKIIAPTISKAFAPSSIPVGTTSTLTFTITNPPTNVVPLTGVAFTDNLPAGVIVTITPDPAQCGGTVTGAGGSSTITLSGGTIVPNSSCTVVVNVTGTTAGTKNNTSGAVTSTNGGNGNTASATLTVIEPPTIAKSFSPGTITAGGISHLTFTLSAPTGNPAALMGIGFTDTLPVGVIVAGVPNTGTNCVGAGIIADAGTQSVSMSGGILAAGATCMATVDVTSNTSGTYDNTTGPVTSMNGGTGAVSNTATLIVTDAADLSITKTDGKLAVNRSEAGTYSIVVHNAGPSDVTGALVTDTIPASLVGATWTCLPAAGASCTASGSGGINDTVDLPVGADVTYTVSATVSATATTDIVNSASVVSLTVTDSNNANNVASDTDHLNLLTIAKSASPATYSALSDTITYSYTITNVGTSTLGAPFAVPDDQVTPVCTAPASLAPGGSFTCIATHAITQSDLDTGSITNQVYATARDADGDTVTSNTDTRTVTATQTASIALTKSATLDDTVVPPSGLANPGDTITYDFSVQNTGNVTLNAIVVTDPLLPGLTCTLSSLAPGVPASCVAGNNVYSLAQTDIDAGVVTNTATVTGNAPDSSTVTDTDTKTVITAQTPGLLLTKTAALDNTVAPLPDVSDVGDTITYGFSIQNNGNVTLTAIVVTDPLLPGLVCTLTSLVPGDSAACVASNNSYALTQADLDNGRVVNTATATGTAPDSSTVSDTDTRTVTLLIPGLAIKKEVSTDGTIWNDTSVTVTVGDTVYYRVSVTNTGDVPLASVNVTDDQCTLTGPSGDTNNDTRLDTTETWIYTCQTTALVGTHNNTASATSAETPNAVTDDASYFAEQGSLEIDKTLASVSFQNPTVVSLTYSMVLHNAGNVDLANVQVVDDLLLAFPAPASHTVFSASSSNFTVNSSYDGGADKNLLAYNPANPNTLASGATGSITLVVQVTNADGQANYTNTADASGVTPTGTTVTATDSAVGPGFIDPALTKAVDPSQAAVGDKVTFTIAVTNNGSLPATNVVVTDPLPGNLDIVTATSSPSGTVDLTTPGTVKVTIATVKPGDLYTIKIVTTVNGLGTPPIENTASLTADPPPLGVGPDPIVNDTSTVPLEITESGGGGGGGSGHHQLPSTGFAPNILTVLPPQPADEAYSAAADLRLEIPSLHIDMPIVGVPASNDTWDVTWLSNQAGWLQGTAFPSWAGNSVLTGHVYLSNGLPGPFLDLHTLAWGDQVIIHLGGQQYIYEVRGDKVVSPEDPSVFQHEAYPWLTLLTCKDYNASSNTYSHRVEVRAVLVKVEADTALSNTAR